MVERPQSEAPSKISVTKRVSPWTMRLIKAIAWMTERDQSDVFRTALFNGLINMAGGSVQSASELIAEWESSQNADQDDKPSSE